MSPAKLEEEGRRVVMNGPRPSPLRIISKDSHVIHKPSSSKQQQRQPVIIYTHSPKIIHTKPRDFMALVQKLTGFSSSTSQADQKIINQEKKDNDSFVTSDYESPYVPEIPLLVPSPGIMGSLSPSFLDFLNTKELLPEY